MVSDPGAQAASLSSNPYSVACARWQMKMKRCGTEGAVLAITRRIIGTPRMGISGLGTV